MAECTAKLRPFSSINDVEITCDKTDEGHERHEGVLRDYLGKGSATAIFWFESDRRNFHGEWPGKCDFRTCVLPRGHHGDHAF